MGKLLHAWKGRVFDNDGRVKCLPWMLIEIPAQQVNKLRPMDPGDGGGVDANQSLSVVMDEGEEVGLLLRIHFRVSAGKHKDCVEIVQILGVEFEFLLGQGFGVGADGRIP